MSDPLQARLRKAADDLTQTMNDWQSLAEIPTLAQAQQNTINLLREAATALAGEGFACLPRRSRAGEEMTTDHVLALERAKRDVVLGIDAAIVTLKGSVEFRNAVEQLLVGTPHGKPADAEYDFEGLYGRLRNALRASSSAPAAGEGWQPEQCICAAIQLPNGEVWRGHRHDDAIRVAGLAPDVAREAIRNAEQGFITSRNRFVGREEGAAIQRRAGIMSAQNLQPVGDVLFSEDLYLRDWRPPVVAAPQRDTEAER